MISKDILPVYAQYNEDIILASLLSEVHHGFYVDVGANHEDYHSVTKYFYKKGWSGINIEPIPRLYQEFIKKRPRDINLQIAISSKKGSLKLREYPDYDGLSTLSEENQAEPSKVNLPHKDYSISVDRLDSVFSEYKVEHIDFLKVDVEGYENEVLQSNDWKRYRPTVICIEANHTLTDWNSFLIESHYVRVIFDGLNEYYVAQESINIFKDFADRATLMAHSAIRSHNLEDWKKDEERIKFLENFTDQQDARIKNLEKDLRNAQPLSMHDKSFLSRLKIVIKGLSIDYFRFRSGR